MLPVVMVCSIALGMAICGTSNSATQFAIYMSCANLGHSAGSKIYGMVAEQSTYAENYMMLGVLVVAMMFALMFYRHRDEGGGDKRATPRYTIPTEGGGAGVFFSGAMRCPKCRADMDPVSFEGTEIDRCSRCGGIWFDSGEMEALASKEAAAAIDTGDSSEGKQYNTIDEYRCPRCGGDMEKRTDSQQTHIWYESCNDCLGSFFDAGEFRDLSELTVSDFFKRLVTPKRE